MSIELLKEVWLHVEEKDRVLPRKRESKIDHSIWTLCDFFQNFLAAAVQVQRNEQQGPLKIGISSDGYDGKTKG